jgi:hypothetical protein
VVHRHELLSPLRHVHLLRLQSHEVTCVDTILQVSGFSYTNQPAFDKAQAALSSAIVSVCRFMGREIKSLQGMG